MRVLFPVPRVLAAALALIVLGGCTRETPAPPPSAGTPAKHVHQAPHGGTPVELGEEAYHLEFVLLAGEGRLQAFVLDGEMENFVRCAAPAFEVIATVAGEPRALTFVAVADAATGEKAGDTALFEARADWLKTTARFDAVLTTLTLRGTTFTAIPFNFPDGSDPDGHNH
jgi:hypothetical protein